MYDVCITHAHGDRAFRNAIAGYLSQYNITMMEWLLLGIAAKEASKGVSMTHSAHVLGVTLPQVTALVAKLAPLGYIQQKSSNVDRRSRIILITSKGSGVFEKSSKVLEDSLSSVFSGVSASDVATYLRVQQSLATQAAS